MPETLIPLTLRISGTFPKYLSNHTYYCNGPGVFEVEHSDGNKWEAEHWFDAIGMVHSFAIARDGRHVTYHSRMTGTSIVSKMQSLPKSLYMSFSVCKSTQDHLSLLDRVRQIYAFSSYREVSNIPYNVSVSLETIPGFGNINARADANVAHRLDADTLATRHKYSFAELDDRLAGEGACGHGILDRDAGEYFNVVSAYSFFGKVDYKVFRVRSNGETDVMTTFRDFPYLIHSFSLTENYVIVNMWPAQLNLMKLLWTKSVSDSCSMRPNTPTKFMVISRKTCEIVATYVHEQFFCFHTINAYESGDDIIIDLGYYKEPNQIMRDLTLDNIRAYGSFEKCVPKRFTLENVSGAAKEGTSVRHMASSRLLADVQMEVGVVAPGYEHKEYRYMYGVSDMGEGALFADVTKLDVVNGSVRRWSVEGTLTGEPLFVADPEGFEEDDGVLLTLVLDTRSRRSSLVAVDARSMKEVGRAMLPMAIPLGFHGCFHNSDSVV